MLSILRPHCCVGISQVKSWDGGRVPGRAKRKTRLLLGAERGSETRGQVGNGQVREGRTSLVTGPCRRSYSEGMNGEDQLQL